ncbi:hypothetical protein [Streptomyces sp. NPDC002537]
MALGRSWMRCTALAAVALLGATVPTTSSAHPPPSGQLQCHGTESVAYSPGVTLLPRDFTVTTEGHFGSCTDSTGSTDSAGRAKHRAKVTSGSYAERFTLFAGCNNLLEGFTVQRTFTWDTGDTSVVDATGSSTAVAGQVITTITGTVTQGRFQGRKAVQIITIPQAGFLQCLTTGLTSATGGMVLGIG